jgi:thymidylate synthase (FAD)
MEAELIASLGNDLTVVNAARVSFDKESDWKKNVKSPPTNKELYDKDIKLIKYLAKHNHFTPFTHCSITLRETVPIFVARQRFKHTIGFTYNEVSRRYVDDDPDFYSPEIWRFKADNIKQGSDEEGMTEIELGKELWWISPSVDGVYRALDQTVSTPKDIYSTCMRTYKALLSLKVCPEQARMVLPQAIPTSYYVTGSLAAFARAYNLRSEETAQEEIKELATKWNEIISKLFPESWKALTNNSSNNKDEEVIH